MRGSLELQYLTPASLAGADFIIIKLSKDVNVDKFMDGLLYISIDTVRDSYSGGWLHLSRYGFDRGEIHIAWYSFIQ